MTYCHGFLRQVSVMNVTLEYGMAVEKHGRGKLERKTLWWGMERSGARKERLVAN